MMYKGFSASGKRDNGILHRSSVTAADKLTDFGDDDVTIADQETGGALTANTAYYATAIPGNSWGNCKVNSNIDTVTTANDGNNTHAVVATIAQCEDAEHYDVFCSTDAAPKFLARITEAQRAAGGRILAVGGPVVGDDASDIAGKIRTALAADNAIDAFFTVSGANAEVILTAKTKAANDTTMNISIADGTCDGITTDTSSTNTTAGVAPVQQVETATIVGTITPGTAQVETATIVGDITTSGNATITVTADGMTGSPKAISVAVTAGTPQAETATVVGTIASDGAGDASVIVTAAGMTNSPKTVTVAVANDDTAAAVGGKIRTALGLDADVSAFFDITGADAEVILTAKAAAANDATMNISIDNDTCSGLTAAPTSADTTAGVAPDDAASVAGKVRTALAADTDVSAFFTVSGSGADVVLTAITAAANDATMNIASDNDTCVGLTPDATSADTTAGVAPGTGNATITVTANGMTGSPKAISVAVTAGDTASVVAGKVRTALTADADVAAMFTVSGSGADVVLTAITAAANDATLNIASDNGTCTGLTTQASSANTTAGNAGTLQVETATVVGDISTSGNATVIVTAAGLTGSPVTVPVAVSNEKDEGVIVIGAVGTGIQTSNDIFAQNNAYTPDDASIVAIDCTGSNNAHVLLKSVLTDLRSAPTLKVIPFTQNKESTTDWHQGALQTIPLLGGAGQSLQQELVFELTEGSDGMKLLIDDISGQGHAVTAYVELS